MSWEFPEPRRDEDDYVPRCPPHAWTTIPFREDVGDRTQHCMHCRVTFRDWARGFGSNVRPKRVVR